QYADFSVTAGISSMNAGKYQEAYDRFRKSIELNPGSPETYFQIGRLYTRTGEVLLARASYLQAIALAPSHVPSLGNIGAGYLAEGHPDSALPYLRRAVEANPRDVPAIEALGDAYRLLGRMEDAKTTYQQAARLGGARARKFLVEMRSSR
ncbi:MAG TPA: tetratricopeptide repeat protein, partial [Bacteroidota bacterium]